ncbi:MAG: RNA-directed DNA polymerase [Chryseobacterium sp.]|uniref:antiviral reverse transcriptase Drt3b n=1 Tax=Chryseobacterium sp. TaxID=1871047 RepID=UPI001B2A1A9B|nr:antiviral reverse transcriptase Drt3b [Chryseobacterium sp.]MBO6183500.1 RNA-directed DNA polymerase [Chryseobacterium sp.]
MGKIKINKEDKTRVILTELLPYEVPMLFSNEGLYNIIKSGELDYFELKVKGTKYKDWNDQFTLPFNYDIKKNIIGDTRTLSVIHPFTQKRFISLFENYDSLMLHLCSKSPFSLRKISKIAKFYFSPNFVFDEENLINPDKEIEPDILDAESQYIKSYYTYKPIDLIYKFYDRNEFQRLEQRYNFLMEFDISKCFYHIYTHSVTWAVKDKESAKINSNKSTFENIFDKLMQHSNYNETNGIVVGPEISRIFSEIILQQIDLNVLKKLNDLSLKFGIDYDVRRYVDDYFVFSNNAETLQQVKKTFQKELQFYKLYLNPNKGDIKISPFLSDIAVGKLEMKEFLIEFYNNLFEDNSTDENISRQIKQINKPYVISQNFIKKFQAIVKRNDLTYDALSKDVVRFLKSKLLDIFKDDTKLSNIERSENFFLMLLDVILYCYSVNINTNTTFRIVQIVVLLVKYLESKSRLDIKHSIYSKIYRDSEFILTNFHRKQVKNETSIETINLLIAIKKLGSDYQFSSEKIGYYFNLEDDKLCNLNYFHFVTLIYYFGNEANYREIKGKIVEEIIGRFKQENVFLKSEYLLLFFDLINCPYIDEKSKREIMKNSNYVKISASNAEIKTEIEKIESQKRWFMNWEQDIDLERVLKKKEWTSSY